MIFVATFFYIQGSLYAYSAEIRVVGLGFNILVINSFASPDVWAQSSTSKCNLAYLTLLSISSSVLPEKGGYPQSNM